MAVSAARTVSGAETARLAMAAVARSSMDEQRVRAVRLADQAREQRDPVLVEPGHEPGSEGLLGGRGAGRPVVDDGAVRGHVVLDAYRRPSTRVRRPGPRAGKAGQGSVELLGVTAAQGDRQAGGAVSGHIDRDREALGKALPRERAVGRRVGALGLALV